MCGDPCPRSRQVRTFSRLNDKHVTRRDLIRRVGASAAAGLALGLPGVAQTPAPAQPQAAAPTEESTPKRESEVAKKYPHPPGKFINRPLTQISTVVDAMLDDMEGRGVAYFYEQAHPLTGLVRDHAPAVGRSDSRVASIAATGFGLSALCIAAHRKYMLPSICEQRVETTLAFLLEQCPHVHGFLYHFLDIESGDRLFGSELSSIDTSILLSGILLCRQYFSGNLRIHALATTLYNRVDWQWMLNGSDTLSMGWLPESGFIQYRWDVYAEMLTMLLMAIGASRNAIPPTAWNAVTRPIIEFGGIEFISGVAPLFIHQYAHAWCDFRNMRDATYQLFCEFRCRDAGASTLLPDIGSTVSLDGPEPVGNHGVGIAHRLSRMGRPAGVWRDRWNHRSLRDCRLIGLFACRMRPCTAINPAKIRRKSLDPLRIHRRLSAADQLVF